jgi:carboxyl-terminal processing protease
MRKKWIFLFAILFSIQICHSSDTLRFKKLELVSKVWGVTVFKTEKHISKPDRELLKLIEKCDDEVQYETFRAEILKWCKKKLKVTMKDSCFCQQSQNPPSLFWISDTTLLGRELSDYLQQEVKKCNINGSSQYRTKGSIPVLYTDKSISAKDKKLAKADYLLAAVKYWNVVNYFYPYMNVPSIHWENQLNEILISFDTITQFDSYYYTLLRTSKKLHDGHARIYSAKASNQLFRYEVPFETEVYEQYTIITKVDSNNSDFKKNDLIVAINNQPISTHLQHWGSLLSSSTRGWFLHTVRNYLFASTDSILNMTIQRGEELINKNFGLVKQEDKPLFTNDIVYNMNKDSIGYIHLGNLQLGHIAAMKRDLKNAKVIIVDARFYPNSTLIALSSWLIDEQKEFAEFEFPVSQCLGSVGKETTTTVINDPSRFLGTVLFLIDRSTISQGEFMAMAFMQSSNVITIGRTTAGAVGTTTQFSLPGKIECRITTSKCTFPNNIEVQQKGIRPSVDLSESNELLCSDDILKFAFSYAKRFIHN